MIDKGAGKPEPVPSSPSHCKPPSQCLSSKSSIFVQYTRQRGNACTGNDGISSEARGTPILTSSVHINLLPTPIIISFTSPSFLNDSHQLGCVWDSQPAPSGHKILPTITFAITDREGDRSWQAVPSHVLLWMWTCAPSSAGDCYDTDCDCC